MNVAELVHARIENSIEELLNKIERNAIDAYLGSFTVGQFTGLINDYRLRYPQNPFVTHEQVRQICLEYDLKLGPELAFVGEIPDQNQKEIDSFVSPDEDVFGGSALKESVSVGAVLNSLRKRFRGEIHIECSAYGGGINIVMRGELEGFSLKKFILPLSDKIAIHYDVSINVKTTHDLPGGAFSHNSRPQMNVIIQDDSFNIASIPISECWCRVGFETGVANSFVSRVAIVSNYIEARIEIEPICNTIQAALESRSLKTSRKVIAPGDLFNTSAMKEVDGYQYALDELAMSKPSVFVDDPIVLEPVKGGYLVVTKWGGESGLIDTNSN